ncbi:MAG: SapC family protein, partial [Gammaproteobacteria bacterium]|nr:SapC family protein [Gammaproteobacteria bacterium]
LVCVDDAVLEPVDDPFFSIDGEITDKWQKTETLIRDMETGRQQTEQLVESIAQNDLLEPFEAHAYAKNGKDLRLRGMYRISETKLNALEGKTVKQLMKRGDLSRIYAHLMSLNNFKDLLDRAVSQSAVEQPVITSQEKH